MIGVFLNLREILRCSAPAVGQRGGGGDIIDILAEKDRAIIGNGLDRGAVDRRMGGPAPGQSRRRLEHEGADGGKSG
ncbi:hypothetical protein C100_14035 [Sphingobium sp. C100]|nr:hypothetical protein C100_14035 [Sphingobium sp. C100]